MFSLSLNPPSDYVAREHDFLDAADRAEKQLGLTDQPRAIVVHEKEGRRHAHVVWSRIDVDEMKAINLPHFKNKLRDCSRDLFLDHGWILPDGLATYGNKSPLNFSLEEWQQAKRHGLDPREIKQAFQQAWQRSDSLVGFKNALEDHGYFLCRGDRRGFVALNVDGKAYAIPKWTGLKAKDVRAKLGTPDTLKSVDEARSFIRSKVTDQLRHYIKQTKERQTRDFAPLRDEHQTMKQSHQVERKKLKDGQLKRWANETKLRSDRLNGGLRGLFDRLTGAHRMTRKRNEREAVLCAKRDQNQRDLLIQQQMDERRKLQEKTKDMRDRHMDERKQLARAIRSSLKSTSPKFERSHERKKSFRLSL